jgi:hypothetical protein
MEDSQPNQALLQELEQLQDDNELLLGLMTGGFAYFFHQLILGHQQHGLAAEACEEIILKALHRIRSTETRFGCEYLSDIEATLEKVTGTQSLQSYLNKITLDKIT